MTSIAENIRQLESAIERLVASHGREPGCVALLAVSKQQSPERMREAYAAGVREFGENYLQEALDKQQALADLEDLVWHYIGPIQSNKTRGIAAHFQWVHSIDRARIARRLNDQRDADAPALNCCVQVNISEESSKSGVMLDELPALCELIDSLPRLQLRGLMAIPAAQSDLADQRDSFRKMAQAFDELQSRFPGMDTLSMGMSGDFEAAIAEGATLLRLGTAVFGPRGQT